MCSWSDSLCQTSCIWVRTESVSHSDTDQAREWMFLFSALRLRLYNRHQTLFASSYSECLSFWLQSSWIWSFCLFVFLIMIDVKWLHHELVLIWWLHCKFDKHWQRWYFRWKSWYRWECWSESLSCSALLSHAHFIIALSSVRFSTFKLMWWELWLDLLAAAKLAC